MPPQLNDICLNRNVITIESQKAFPFPRGEEEMLAKVARANARVIKVLDGDCLRSSPDFSFRSRILPTQEGRVEDL